MNPSLDVLATLRGGVFTRADARECGYPDPDIDFLLKSGGWRRLRPGVYAPRRGLRLVTHEMLYLRRVARVLRGDATPSRSRGRPGLIASHQSAAALHGLPLWGIDLSLVHVTAANGRAGRHAGGVYRHVRDPVGHGTALWNQLGLVSVARAVVEVAATSARSPSVVLADAALSSGLTTHGTLRRAADQLDRDADRAIRAITAARPDSGSVAESRLRLILSDAGLPEPSPYAWPFLPGADEPTVDPAACLWFPDQRTVVEFEPHRPYWRGDPTTDQEPEPPDLPSGPEPVEYCWIPWTALDTPDLIATRIRTTFTRAARRTALRHLEPTRKSGR